MAVTKKSKTPKVVKAVRKVGNQTSRKGSAPEYDFTGFWQSYESRFWDTITERTPPSTWMISKGNIYVYNAQAYQCKVTKNKIKIPTGTPKCFWMGEMLPENILKISTSNGMMSYYCKRA